MKEGSGQHTTHIIIRKGKKVGMCSSAVLFGSVKFSLLVLCGSEQVNFSLCFSSVHRSNTARDIIGMA